MKIALICVTLLGMAAPCTAEQLYASCAGSGAANQETRSTEFNPNEDGAYAAHTFRGGRVVAFEDHIDLAIDGDTGKVRMPPAMIPPIHGGTQGWFPLKSIKANPREITASVSINLMNSPRLRFDRATARISIEGKAGTFSGKCKPDEAAAGVPEAN